jgi:hypothetical protein
MSVSQLLIVAVAVGIAVNLYDYLVHGILLQGPLYSHLTIMRPTVSIWKLVLLDFVAALVFVWVFQRVRASFGPGARGGAVFGLYAAILVNFPTWLFSHLLQRGFTTQLALAWTVVGLGWGLVAGAVAGAVGERVAHTA